MKRVALGLAALLVGLTAIIGVAHTKVGRPLLAYMPWGKAVRGVCPLGYDAPITAESRAAAQKHFASIHRGEVAAASRPALGFALAEATAADIHTWAAAADVTCQKPRVGHDLECNDVSARSLPTPDEGAALSSLWLDFGVNGKLVTVIGLRRDKNVDAIATAFEQVKARVTEAAGSPLERPEQPVRTELLAGLLRQATAEFRFSNYYATASAMQMADGFLLTEEYHALN